MRCSFRPHDHDRTTEIMEGVLVGFGPLRRGVGLQHTRVLYGSPVNRWSIKPNGMKLDRRSTGSVLITHKYRVSQQLSRVEYSAQIY